MTLAPGTLVGPFEIVDGIGAGGMGEVYRAIDTKLDREVAIKTLPSALSADTDRLARFEREAKLLAALNHPNIAIIYGLEEHDSTQCIAMELIEGETLEEKLKDGSLQLEDALRLALQIAQALEAAHEKGVVHRDLKPANVMVTKDGLVKVLDFGLAKAFSDDPDTASAGQSPALSLAMTQQGLVLGTAAYMSPEQASGQATDQRADVWAFGVVLFEVLSGLPLFTGESVPHILAAVLQSEPDWERLPNNLHPRLRVLLERCLTKKPRNRYHSIADVRIEIENLLDNPQESATSATVPETDRVRHVLPLAAGSLACGAVLAAVLAWILWPSVAPRPVDRFSYELPNGQLLNGTNRRVIEVSPNGRYFVYNTTDGLYLRAMGELEARRIVETSVARSPTFSPDSQSLAYYDTESNELNRIAISGGTPVLVAEFPGSPFGLSWNFDGTILFVRPDGIYRVLATGGTPELVITKEGGELFHGPRLLPDGDTVIYTVDTTQGIAWDDAQIVAQSISTGERSVLVESGVDARFIRTGHLVYTVGDAVFARVFDPNSLIVSGGAVPLVQGVMQARAGGGGITAASNFSVSDDGTLVYVSGSLAAPSRQLVWVDREGRETTIDAPLRNYTYPRISPDGTRVALDVRDQELDIWILEVAREALTRLTFDPEADEYPLWSADGDRIAFASSRLGNQAVADLLWQAADGTGRPDRLVEGSGQTFPTAFLPDGEGILFWGDSDSRPGYNNDDISILRFEGEQDVVSLLNSTFAEKNPELSRDGQWLAYSSDETGTEQIYVRPFPNVEEGRWPVSTDGGTQPLWAHNGQELFFRNGDSLMRVDMETNPDVSIGSPELLFEGSYFVGPGGRSYDVSNDDQRFLLIQEAEDTSAAPRVVVVLNWFEELKRLVPVAE